MAGNAEDPRGLLSPPRFAQALIAMAAEPADRAVLIGDLEEEFARLRRRSPNAARAWYWRQTAGSAPHLAMKRLRSSEAQRIALTFIIAAAAFFLLRYWDVFIARNAARLFFELTSGESYTPSRVVYFVVQAAGFLIAGAAVAMLAFKKTDTLAKNFAFRLAPVGALLLAPILIAAVGGGNYPTGLRVLQIALAAPALVLGAWLAVRFFRNR